MEGSERYRMDRGEKEKSKSCDIAPSEFVTIWQQFFFIFFFPERSVSQLPHDVTTQSLLAKAGVRMLGWNWDGTLLFE